MSNFGLECRPKFIWSRVSPQISTARPMLWFRSFWGFSRECRICHHFHQSGSSQNKTMKVCIFWKKGTEYFLITVSQQQQDIHFECHQLFILKSPSMKKCFSQLFIIIFPSPQDKIVSLKNPSDFLPLPFGGLS